MKKFSLSNLKALPENAVFWLLLMSLATGSAGSLYLKIAGKTDSLSEIADIAPAASVTGIRAETGAGPAAEAPVVVSPPLSREQALSIIRSDIRIFNSAGQSYHVYFDQPLDCTLSNSRAIWR